MTERFRDIEKASDRKPNMEERLKEYPGQQAKIETLLGINGERRRGYRESRRSGEADPAKGSSTPKSTIARCRPSEPLSAPHFRRFGKGPQLRPATPWGKDLLFDGDFS